MNVNGSLIQCIRKFPTELYHKCVCLWHKYALCTIHNSFILNERNDWIHNKPKCLFPLFTSVLFPLFTSVGLTPCSYSPTSNMIKNTIKPRDCLLYGLFNHILFTCSFSDFHPAASLTVSPDRVQHFIQDSVTLKCDGNSTSWKVMKFNEYGYMTLCSYRETMTGSTCNTHTSQYISGVYWCESETGQFSNGVNITGQCEFKSHFLYLNYFNTTLVL